MIILKVKKLNGFMEKSFGLIGKTRIYPVHFVTRWGIHTFGVLAPIDVLILDKNMCVVTMAHGLAPNRVFFWNPVHCHVVELSAGEIRKKKIQAGDTIRLLH